MLFKGIKKELPRFRTTTIHVSPSEFTISSITEDRHYGWKRENLRGGAKTSPEASYWHLLEFPFHMFSGSIEFIGSVGFLRPHSFCSRRIQDGPQSIEVAERLAPLNPNFFNHPDKSSGIVLVTAIDSENVVFQSCLLFTLFPKCIFEAFQALPFGEP